jgi:restriction endonuclease S subunit
MKSSPTTDNNLDLKRKEWDRAALRDVCDYIQRGKSPKYSSSGSCLVISQKCVRWSGFDSEPARYIEDSSLSGYSDDRFLKDGDLLWNSTGTGTVGRTAIFKHHNPDRKYVADSHVTVLRTSNLNHEFLYYWSRSPKIQHIVANSTTGSTNQQELNLGILKELTISFPSPVEQEIKVKRIKELFHICDELQSRTTEVTKLADKFARSVVAALA